MVDVELVVGIKEPGVGTHLPIGAVRAPGGARDGLQVHQQGLGPIGQDSVTGARYEAAGTDHAVLGCNAAVITP